METTSYSPAATVPPRPTTRGTGPFRLSARGRKLMLLAHIVSAGAWIGLDVVLGVLVFTAMGTGDSATKAVSLQALELFAVWPLATVAILTLVTGVVLGLGTKYGLIRYWWVAVKLVMNIVLAGLVLFLLRPGVHEAADYGRQLAAGHNPAFDISGMVFPPIVSTSAVVFATVLSVFKPWGRRGRTTR
jgi:uncharacterized membrane protein